LINKDFPKHHINMTNSKNNKPKLVFSNDKNTKHYKKYLNKRPYCWPFSIDSAVPIFYFYVNETEFMNIIHDTSVY